MIDTNQKQLTLKRNRANEMEEEQAYDQNKFRRMRQKEWPATEPHTKPVKKDRAKNNSAEK